MRQGSFHLKYFIWIFPGTILLDLFANKFFHHIDAHFFIVLYFFLLNFALDDFTSLAQIIL